MMNAQRWVGAAALLLAACGTDGDLGSGRGGGQDSGAGGSDGGPDAGGSSDLDGGANDAGGGGALTVDVEQGRLRGLEVDEAVAFLGVPFAAPPVGARRWRPPEPAPPWTGTRPATALSSPCVQVSGTYVSDDGEPGMAFGDEDCLYLNIWTPKDRFDPDAELPVLFFVHGGGNVAGSTAEPLSSVVAVDDDAVPLYDGRRLAARGDLVVVTTNYRLGVLGFLALDALDDESATGTSGNYGLRDQIAALEWVQRNIRAFGGDPRRVTLVGQSGGGRDVNLLNVSPRAEGLFAAVAVHSAPLGAAELQPLKARAEDLAEEMGCAGARAEQLACLRQIRPERLVTAEAAQPLGLASAAFRPAVDGDVVTDQPRLILATGGGLRAPMLLSNLELEYAHRWTQLTAAAYPAAVAAMVGATHAPAVIEQYPLDRFASASQAFSTLMSDRNVTCPYRSFARMVAASGIPVWMARFGQLLPESVRRGDGAYHTSELVYLFQHLDGDTFPATDGDRATQALMAHYWATFARTGDPDSGTSDAGLPVAPPAWPRFDADTERYLELSEAPSIAASFGAADCDFWDSLRP